MFLLAGAAPVAVSSQQRPSVPTSLVFDGATVVDVEYGKLVPDQRVVIAGNRIRAVGDVGAVAIPRGAQVVDARGKYLIPGFWDVHTHVLDQQEISYPLFVAYGVTGIRDAGSAVPLQSLTQRRREIMAGARVGPPRQLFAGPSLIEQGHSFCQRPAKHVLCITLADARRVVDSLKTAGADMIKTYAFVETEFFFALAAEARRQGVRFGGHLDAVPLMSGIPADEASDSGLSIADHLSFAGQVGPSCAGASFMGAVQPDEAACKGLAERFRHNGTWWVPTLVVLLEGFVQQEHEEREERGIQPGIPWSERSTVIAARHTKHNKAFWSDSGRSSPAPAKPQSETPPTDTNMTDAADAGVLAVAQRVGLPILAGTDVSWERGLVPGLALHDELELMVAEGLTPLTALQAATLNPAKMLRATDSLGTVAVGKLADLVLLDKNPLVDITNTTTIRAVVANGRYFDRTTLDSLLAEARVRAKAIEHQAP